MTTSLLRLTGPALCASLLLVAACTQPENSPEAVTAGPDGFIAGGVQSAQGPEAGVWVIAETKDLPTKFVKIVVTDDDGRFMLPELPDASYDVWVRGYGLVDSAPLEMRPTADPVTLQATAATTPEEAAKVYPGDYWLSLMAPPDESLFPGTGDDGNGMGTRMLSQAHWLDSLKSDCNFCHQLGSRQTRTVDHVFEAKPELTTHEEAWEWRLGTGVRGNQMYSVLRLQGMEASLDVYADWTERIAAGELPPAPPRPQGIERNLVLTLWDVGSDKTFMHDLVSTDKNNPGVNAGGPDLRREFGARAARGHGPRSERELRQEHPHQGSQKRGPVPLPAADAAVLLLGRRAHLGQSPLQPFRSAQSDDRQQGPGLADFEAPRSAAASGLVQRSGERVRGLVDAPARRPSRFVLRPGGPEVHADRDLLQHPPPPVRQRRQRDRLLQRRRRRPFLGRHEGLRRDRRRAAGRRLVSPGRRHERRRRDHEALERRGRLCGRLHLPGRCREGPGGTKRSGRGRDHAGARSPVRHAAFVRPLLGHSKPGRRFGVGRLPDLSGLHHPSDARGGSPGQLPSQIFRVPEPGFDPRGIDITSDGVVWTALAGSSHLASLDVRKCEPRDEPDSPDGRQCPEGWSLYRTEGPTMKGTDVPADFHYYNWVDQHDIAGLGENTPIATGSNSDSLLALDPETGEWTTLRVPYPLGFFSRGLDGRIDDPDAGWKGRALWANYGTNYIWHTEGGKGTRGKFVKFQIRPDPLAR